MAAPVDKEPKFIAWPSISQLHGVIADVKRARNFDAQRPVVYRGKVKLHGQNAAVTAQVGGSRVQSRNQFVEGPGKMHALMSAYIPAVEALLTPELKAKGSVVTVFGEYAGPGVQGGLIALNLLKNNLFAVFSVLIDDQLFVEPDDITRMLTDNGRRALPEHLHVLPWYTDPIEVSLLDVEEKNPGVELINRLVVDIDKEDPWVRSVYGVAGPGEGLVLFPVSAIDRETRAMPIGAFSLLSFKAKGEAHRVVKSDKAAKAVPEVAPDALRFAELMVTHPRCLQAVENSGGLHPSNTGAFLKWIVADIEKEGQAELEANNLQFKAVSKTLNERARLWYSTAVKAGTEAAAKALS